MTAQISDIIIYNGQNYDLTGFTEELPFIVESFGLNPQGTNSACWRGFQRTFLIIDNQLLIKTLSLNEKNKSQNSNEIEIYGKKPLVGIKKTKSLFFNKRYDDLNHLIKYTGSILIGTEFKRELYTHMGFHPAWKYNKVIDLTFENGLLIDSIDLSLRMKEVRKELKDDEDNLKKFNQEDWIESTFNQKYKK